MRMQTIQLNAPQRHTLVFAVRNNPGVVQRIASVFSRRGVALQELYFRQNGAFAQVHLSFEGSDWLAHQVTCQMEKLLDAVSASGEDLG